MQRGSMCRARTICIGGGQCSQCHAFKSAASAGTVQQSCHRASVVDCHSQTSPHYLYSGCCCSAAAAQRASSVSVRSTPRCAAALASPRLMY